MLKLCSLNDRVSLVPMTELLHHCAAQGHQLQVLISSIQQTLVNHLGKEENCNNQQAFSLFIIFCGNPNNRIFQLNHLVLHSYQSVQCVCVHACVCAHLLHNYAWTLVDIYILIFSITFFISMYIMCVCLFSALSRRVGALQISIIIIILHCITHACSIMMLKGTSFHIFSF